MGGARSARRTLRGVLIGAGAAIGVSALGLDASVTLSTYGLYLGEYGPFLVIAGVPIFLNFAFAYVLLRSDQGLIRYSMVATGIVFSLVAGFLAYVGIFQGLIPSN